EHVGSGIDRRGVPSAAAAPAASAAARRESTRCPGRAGCRSACRSTPATPATASGRIRRSTGIKLPTGRALDRDVQLADRDLQPKRCVIRNRLIQGGVVDAVRAPVTLNAYAVDRRAILDQAFEQHHRALMLRAALD